MAFDFSLVNFVCPHNRIIISETAQFCCIVNGFPNQGWTALLDAVEANAWVNAITV